jgi:carbamoyltransferase
MIKWGVAAGTHDGSLAVVKDNEILFASHTERYSRKKNDAHLNQEMI